MMKMLFVVYEYRLHLLIQSKRARLYKQAKIIIIIIIIGIISLLLNNQAVCFSISQTETSKKDQNQFVYLQHVIAARI
jgi:uncharacterized membrane protein